MTKKNKNKATSASEVPANEISASEISASEQEAFYKELHKLLAKRVSASRLEHIEGVAKTAKKLAKIYGEDEWNARLAGLLHDWDKGFSDEEIRVRARELGLEIDEYIYDNMPRLLHGLTASAALEREYPQINGEVLQAIRRHTTADVNMSDLDMIVYVADLIEPNRKFADAEYLRDMVGKVSLEDLFFYTFGCTIEAIVRRKLNMYPKTVDVWNVYVARHNARKE